MCASALRQLQIRRVFFGCLNDRFGGTGGVLKIHEGPGVDPGYPCYGGINHDEAIMLLRRFYIQENERAPQPLAKKTRTLKTEVAPFGAGVSRDRNLGNKKRELIKNLDEALTAQLGDMTPELCSTPSPTTPTTPTFPAVPTYPKSQRRKKQKREEAAQKEAAQIQAAQIQGAQIQGAQIQGAQIQGAQKEAAQKEGAQKEATQIQGAQIQV
jgi:hypothetical protein